MSYTELFKFGTNGKSQDLGEVKNAFRGAMAIWKILENRYLPKNIKPGFPNGFPRCIDPIGIKEIWNLAESDKISEVDKIVLLSTFDKVLVKKENFSRLIEAFRKFEGETSLKEQADLIEAVENDIIAIGWNQTSVNWDTWKNFGWDEEKEETLPYNMIESEEHWFLFDDIDKTEKPETEIEGKIKTKN